MNIQQPSKQHVDKLKDNLVINRKSIVIMLVLFFLIFCWYSRYEVTAIDGQAVAYLNKWTGTVTVVNQFGKANQLNLLENHW